MPKGTKNPTKPGYKMCRGPLHREGEWIPRDEFRFMKQRNMLFSECKACERFRTAHNHKRNYKVFGFVYFDRYAWVFTELVRRLGKRETARRVPMSYNTLWKTMSGQQKKIHRETVRRALILLMEIRANGEVRHRDSIAHGAHLRGRKEKVPKLRRDFYVVSYDNENMNRWKKKETTV